MGAPVQSHAQPPNQQLGQAMRAPPPENASSKTPACSATTTQPVHSAMSSATQGSTLLLRTSAQPDEAMSFPGASPLPGWRETSAFAVAGGPLEAISPRSPRSPAE